jgi:hypothetical protein
VRARLRVLESIKRGYGDMVSRLYGASLQLSDKRYLLPGLLDRWCAYWASSIARHL